jgi:signal transduction histidine kinase/CheY-like chemotaxis protein
VKPYSKHVLIVAPFGRNAATAQSVLQQHGITSTIFGTVDMLADDFDDYAGAIMVTDEALAASDLGRLARRLDAQPTWSDMPFIVLTQRTRGSAHQQARLRDLLPERLTNIVYLERPTSALSIASTVEIALSARWRQFQTRDELRAAVAANERLRATEAALARSHSELERLVQQRTQALEDSNRQLLVEAAERKRAEAALLQAQKMEAVGRLTGGIAHDFNNLLMAIVGNLALLRHHLGTDNAAQRFIDNAQRATDRGAKLSAQLLAFSRTQKLSLQSVNVDAAMQELLPLARHSFGPLHDMRTAFNVPDTLAVADVNQLELAVLNLITNARDAMPDGGRITISTQKMEVGDDDPRLHPGAYVSISVADEGCGIDEDTLRHIFEPFFTTKPVGKGTGLGLAQVWGVAHQCGGTVKVESTPARGTTFHLLFPVSTATPSAAAADPTPAGQASGAEGLAVLVVDDDDSVRESLMLGLEMEGFDVSGAADGASGLQMITEATPAVLIVDYAMPKMSGAEVARAAQRLRPDLPVIMVTGYSDTPALDRVANATVLRKPVALKDLRDAILLLAGARAASGPPPVM